MMAVVVHPGTTFTAGAPHALFVVPFTPFSQFDVAPDVKHFYITGYETRPSSPIVFVPDVTADLRSLAQTGIKSAPSLNKDAKVANAER